MTRGVGPIEGRIGQQPLGAPDFLTIATFYRLAETRECASVVHMLGFGLPRGLRFDVIYKYRLLKWFLKDLLPDLKQSLVRSKR